MKHLFATILFIALTLPASAEARWLGDVNGDKEVTLADARALSDIILGKAEAPQDITLLDVNGDKQLTIADVIMIVNIVTEKIEKTKVWVPDPDSVVETGGKGTFD